MFAHSEYIEFDGQPSIVVRRYDRRVDSQGQLWSILHVDALGLGGEGEPIEVRGTTGTVERVGERQTLIRLTAPVPGMLNVFAHADGEATATTGVRAYLFSADAAAYVRREEPAWQAWLRGLSAPPQ